VVCSSQHRTCSQKLHILRQISVMKNDRNFLIHPIGCSHHTTFYSNELHSVSNIRSFSTDHWKITSYRDKNYFLFLEPIFIPILSNYFRTLQLKKNHESTLSGQLGYTVNLVRMKKLWNIHHIGPHKNMSPVICCWHRWTFFIHLTNSPPQGTHYTDLKCSLSRSILRCSKTKSSQLHLKFKPCCNTSMIHFC